MGLWVRRLLPIMTALTAIPLMATASYGQLCTSDSLRQAIAQLQNPQNRPQAQASLKQCGEVAVQPLASALNVDDTITRRYAAETLGQIGQEAKSAVLALVRVSQGDSDPQIRSVAVQALSAIGKNSQANSSQLQGWQIGQIQDLKTLQQQLNQALTALQQDKTDWATKADDLNTLRRAADALQTQLDKLTKQPNYQVLFWGQSHPWIVLIGAGAIAIITTHRMVFWLRPLWLLKLGDGAIQAIAKLPQVGAALSGVLKVLLPLKYHPRVLDAWVEQHWQAAQAGFLSLDTVKDRQIHIPLPVHLDGTVRNPLSSSDLSLTFRNKTAVLLITGEGGAGKTSLACQIALWGLEKCLITHRLLPVLIETELDDKKPLIEAIGGQLKVLINQQDNLPPELLQKLLQHQRILVIVDHLSEMSETTRKQVTPELANFPAKALIVTSRLHEPLGRVPKTVLKPLQIETNRLWKFIPDYLESIKKRDLFEDDEYSDACDRLRRIAGERPITVLLARLYIDHMIQEREGAGGILPDSVPKLMLSYLNRLNQNIDPTQKRDDLDVQRDAQIVAWECLKQTYRPTLVKKEDAIAALAKEADDAKARLDYLEQRLQVLQSPEPRDKTRIILDPLAEYLAATYCVEHNCHHENPETAWREFFQEIDQKLDQSNEASDVIRGFLLAVWDCCEDQAKETRIPDFVTAELDPKAGVNRQELERVHC
jgi:HEAT repeat protein